MKLLVKLFSNRKGIELSINSDKTWKDIGDFLSKLERTSCEPVFEVSHEKKMLTLFGNHSESSLRKLSEELNLNNLNLSDIDKGVSGVFQMLFAYLIISIKN